VERSDGERDVFLHISSLERINLNTIDQGTSVRFDIIEDRKQPGRFKINNIELI
jgi:cold shock CspA family protein